MWKRLRLGRIGNVQGDERIEMAENMIDGTISMVKYGRT